jgi:DNA-binding transcriptional ArsR family regulator
MTMRWLGFGVDAVVSRMVHAFSNGSAAGQGWPAVPVPVRREEPPAVAPSGREGEGDLQRPGIKLVRYTLVSLRRCAERILPDGTGEVLVTGRVSNENFAVGIVIRYLESHEIPHEDKKYLRVSHQVLDRWEPQPFRCWEERELAALEGVRRAIVELGDAPPPVLEVEPPPAPEAVEPAPPPAVPAGERVLQALLELGQASADLLADRTGLSKKRVSKSLKALEEADRVRRSRRGNKTFYHPVTEGDEA